MSPFFLDLFYSFSITQLHQTAGILRFNIWSMRFALGILLLSRTRYFWICINTPQDKKMLCEYFSTVLKSSLGSFKNNVYILCKVFIKTQFLTNIFSYTSIPFSCHTYKYYCRVSFDNHCIHCGISKIVEYNTIQNHTLSTNVLKPKGTGCYIPPLPN